MSIETEAAPRPRRWLVYLPLAIFAALAWLLFPRVKKDLAGAVEFPC
jgi:hypothetical protein